MRLRDLVRRKFPEIDMDAGTFVHALFGFLGPALGRLVGALVPITFLFAALFVTKQLLDVYGGEVPKVTGGDIAEFSAGLIAGLAAAGVA